MKKRVKKQAIKDAKWLFLILLFVSVTHLWGQTISGVTAQSPVHFAESTDFSVGELTISFNMPAGKTSAELRLVLAAGIEYMPSTVTATGATIALKAGSTDANKPVFTLTNASGSVTVKLKRKAIKVVLSNNALATGLYDEAVLVVQGLSPSPVTKNTAPYVLPRPTLTVQQPETVQNNAAGTHTKEYTIRNTGNGKVRDVYFSIDYPPGVTGNSVAYEKAGTYTTLTAVGTVPTGFVNAGKPLYKVPAVNLANNQEVKIRENYTVTGCTSGRQVTYVAYWGSSATDIFENSPSATKTINIAAGKPLINIDRDKNSSYFTWGDGLAGNKLGTFTVRYFNNGTGDNPIASKISIKLFERHTGIFDSHKPTNFRLVYTDGGVEKEISIPPSAISQPEANKAIEISFDNMPALSTSDPTHGGKNIGFTDEDGDGYRDELKKNVGFTLRFDYVKNNGITCLSSGQKQFLINPSSEMYCYNICGEKSDNGGAYLYEQTFVRFVNAVSDGSYFPDQLVENVSKPGYLIANFNVSGYSNSQRVKGQDAAQNARLYKYEIKLPAGIALKNVKFHKGFKYGTATEAPISLSDVAAGGTLTYTTGTTAYGYITFDILLTSCSGTNATIDYHVWYLDKNGSNNSYSEIPYVCTNKVVNTVCSTPCSVNGPTMLSTKVERADNSYGWKDYTMAVRQTRDQVSELQRQRALYLDDIEVISEGKELGTATSNLYYHATFAKAPGLEPKSLKFTVGSHTVTLPATAVTKSTVGDKDYFLWNLTSALPGGNLPKDATFSVVATYQVKNNRDDKGNNSHDIESGGENFFYRLDNPATDTALNTQGYHTAQKHCGANLYATFFYANLWNHLNTNTYYVDGCAPAAIGSNQVYAGRRFDAGGNYFTDEFRPSRLIRKLTFKIPSSMNYVGNPTYIYRQKYGTESSPISFVLTPGPDDGTYKTYTYVNPAKDQPGHLPVGEISVENFYDSYIKTVLQATCKTKVWDNFAKSKADNMLVKSEIEYEDFYYHYAARGGSAVRTYTMPEGLTAVYHRYKPEVTITSNTPLTVKVNKREQELGFTLANATQSDAPYGWISIPDVTGIEVLSLQEGTNTYTPQTSITGEKMFFLSEKGNDGKILKSTSRQFKLKYKVTNCAVALQLKVYAGWNCNGNPTTGYRNTCSEASLTYNLTIAQSKKEIRADPTNPGENKPNKKGEIPMCAPTTYKYEINSADEGDIYNAKLVVTQGNGITISNVKVEYPLGGTVYTVGTGAGKILHTQSGNRHTYDISNILPEGSLPGSLNEPNNANKRKFKLTFDVTPDCDFSAGSSFDIDVEGTNLCDSPAEGDKTRAIVAGITGANVPDYGVQITMDKDLVGNLSSCGNSQKIEFTVAITHPNPLYQLNSTEARVHVRIPKGYELKSLEPKEPPVVLLPLPPDWSERKEDEEKVIGDEQELVFTIPKNMLVAPYSVGWILELQQKDDAKVPCDPSKIKAFASDRVTGITCNGQACPTLPRLITSTTVEKNLINQRPALSFTDLNITSAAKSGKEELTIKYKLSNAVTTTDHAADLPATQQVKIDLYKDTNNNGRFDAADTKLSTTPYTFQEAVVEGASSSEKTITALVDQGDVCRLLLVINNDTNKCLCKDVYTQLTPSATLTNLVPDLTVCEGETKKVAYGVAGGSYEAYTWSGKTTDDNITYLSATNVKEPNFHYTGTKLTATKIFTYILKVKRTNGCEATQEVTVTVTPQTATPADKEVLFCQGDTYTVGTLKTKLFTDLSLPTGTIVKVYTAGNTTVSLTDATPVVRNTDYLFTITKTNECESATAKVYVKGLTAPTVAQTNQAFCGAKTVADLQPQGTNYAWFATQTGGTALAPATALVDNTVYYVAKKNGTCQSERVAVKVQLLPAPPTGQNYTFCKGATVYDLKKKIDATRPETIKVYHNNVPLTGDNERLPDTGTFKVSRGTASCETDKVDVGVAFTELQFTSLTANPTFLPEAGGTVTFTIKGTPGATVSYTDGTNTGTKVLDTTGEATVSKITVNPITLTVTKIEKDGCELSLSQSLSVAKACGGSIPAPQFAQTATSQTTMNNVGVKRVLSGAIGNAHFTPTLSSDKTCKPSYQAGYVHMHSTKTTKVVYTFDEPITSVDVYLMMMGERNFFIDYKDRAQFEVNCGTLRLDVINDCRGDAVKEGYTITARRLNDLVVRVSSNKPFTTLTIRQNNDLITDGYAMELCPSSVRKADLLQVITQPQPTEVCEGSTARFTSKVKLKAGLVGQIGYQWQVSTNGTSWSDVGSTRYANSEEEVVLSIPNTIVAQHNRRYYRVRYTYERATAICDAKVTEYSQSALLTVNGKAEVSSITATPPSITQGSPNSVVFIFRGTPGATVVYTLAGGAPEEITLDATGKATLNKTLSQATTLLVTQVKKGDCTYPSSQRITVNAGCGANKPAPQFATGLNVKKTMNEVEVTRDLDGNISYSPVDNDPAYCNGPFEAGYVWMGRDLAPLPTDLTKKTTYHFNTPVTSAEIWFMGMGKSGFVNQNFKDRATITVNCGTVQVTKVSDCRDNNADTYSKVFNGNQLEGKGLTDVVVKVTSDKPFTRIVIQDGNNDGVSDPAASGYYVELCPSSIQKADILFVEQEPQSENHCEGGETAFTAQAQLGTGYTGTIAYQWETSTDGLTWTALTGKNGNTASGTAQVLALTTTRAMDNTWYRMKYTYTEAAPSRLCSGVSVTRYTEAARLRVTGIDKPVVSEVTAQDCDNDSVVKINSVVTGATYSFVRISDNASFNATVAADGTITGLPAGTYRVTATKDSCSSEASDDFEVKAAKAPAQPIVQEKTFATCTDVSVAKLTNYVEGATYTFIKADGTTVTGATIATDGTITGLAVGTYKVKAEKNSCTSAESAEFEIKNKLAPAIPTIEEVTAPTCDDAAVVKVSNYIEGATYTFIKTADNTEVTGVTIANDGKVSGLGAGTYKIKVKVNECTSELSDAFEVKAKKGATMITTHPVGATYVKDATATALSVVSSGTTPTAYKWYRNTTNSKTGSDVTQVATTATYTPLTNQIGSLFYWVELTGCGTVESAIAEIKVTSSAPTITANDDPDTSVAKGGEVEVLSNDRLNGNPVAPTDVDITIPNNGGLTGLTVDSSTGKLKVPNTATPGTYEVTYQICVAGGTTTCDTAKVKITVTSTPPPTIVANDDPDTSVAKGGEVEVLSNDRLNGNPVSPTDVDITIPNNGGLTGLTADATTGKLKVPANATPGTYEVTYQICVAGGTTTCDTAKVKITVNGRTIEAHDDGPWKVGTLGGLTPSILNNDILNGSPVSPNQVNIERTNGRPSLTDHFQRNEDGRISVLPQPQGLPRLTAGTYEYYYTIVDKTNSSNAASAKATIIVSDFVAADDVFEFGNPNNRTLTTESVLKNDQVGDKRNPSPTDDVNLTPGTASHPGLTMNPDGTITIASGTPNGNYTYTYEICKKDAPTECERAIAYIKLHDSLEANDDDFSSTPVPSSHKTVVGNVLTNNVGGTDKLSGAPISDPTLVELTIVNEGGLTGVELSGNGDISISAGTPSGRYIVKYRISQVSDRNNYKEAVVTIVVSNEIPLVFHNGISVNGDGKNDGFVIEGIEHYPDNVLRIFNRWGVLVYEKERYGNRDPFVGISNGRATVSKDTKLPQGTYYYLLEYTDLKGNRQEKSGWLYLKTE